MSGPARSHREPAAFLLAAALILLPLPARAGQALFDIQDLVFSGPSGQNGVGIPVYVSEPGVVGHLLWTYTAGDFAGGSGTLLDLALPFTWFPVSQAVLNIDNTAMAGSQPGNTHNLTYDWTITFRTPLSSPTSVSAIDSTASPFDFTGVYNVAPGVGFNGEWLGNVTAGTIVPDPVPLDAHGAIAGTALAPPAPNPFRDATSIACSLERPGPVTLAVYGVDGRRVATLYRGVHPAGRWSATWDGRTSQGRMAAAGLYYVRLTTPGGGLTRRLVRLN